MITLGQRCQINLKKVSFYIIPFPNFNAKGKNKGFHCSKSQNDGHFAQMQKIIMQSVFLAKFELNFRNTRIKDMLVQKMTNL